MTSTAADLMATMTTRAYLWTRAENLLDRPEVADMTPGTVMMLTTSKGTVAGHVQCSRGRISELDLMTITDLRVTSAEIIEDMPAEIGETVKVRARIVTPRRSKPLYYRLFVRRVA